MAKTVELQKRCSGAEEGEECHNHCHFWEKGAVSRESCSFSSLQRVCLTKVREWKIAILAQEWDDLKPDSEMLCDVESGGNPTGPRAQQGHISMSQSGCLAQVKPLFCVRRS